MRDRKFDGMIITGAPLENVEYEEMDYWDELCGIMDWNLADMCSTLYICWGTLAGLYHHYGVSKYRLDSKISGIFKHRVLISNELLMRGFNDRF